VVPATPVPALPVAPRPPVEPVVPPRPLVPATPLVPAVPLGPARPLVPEPPLVPATPLVPAAPVVPAAPLVPAVPVALAAPVGPAAPAVPAAPLLPAPPATSADNSPAQRSNGRIPSKAKTTGALWRFIRPPGVRGAPGPLTTASRWKCCRTFSLGQPKADLRHGFEPSAGGLARQGSGRQGEAVDGAVPAARADGVDAGHRTARVHQVDARRAPALGQRRHPVRPARRPGPGVAAPGASRHRGARPVVARGLHVVHVEHAR